jgi:malic enzyme
VKFQGRDLTRQIQSAIIIAAGLLNALEIQGKMPENAMLTCLGAGAAGIATLDLLCELGFQKSNIYGKLECPVLQLSVVQFQNSAVQKYLLS